jgi:hypothetical protein
MNFDSWATFLAFFSQTHMVALFVTTMIRQIVFGGIFFLGAFIQPKDCVSTVWLNKWMASRVTFNKLIFGNFFA